MRVLIIGSLAGELGQAARIAIGRGAKLDQADDADSALVRLRADARIDLVLCDIAHDVGAVVARAGGRAHRRAGRRLRHRRRSRRRGARDPRRRARIPAAAARSRPDRRDPGGRVRRVATR